MIHSTTAASSSTSLLAVAVGTVSSESVAAFGSILADAGFAGTPPATPTLTLTVPTLSLPVTDGVRQAGAATGKALPLESAQRDISVAPIDPLVALLTPTPAAPAQTPGATANQAATATPIAIPATVIAAKATASSEATPTPRLASLTRKPTALKSEATPRDVAAPAMPAPRLVAKDDTLDTDQPEARSDDSAATAPLTVDSVLEITQPAAPVHAVPVAVAPPGAGGVGVAHREILAVTTDSVTTSPRQAGVARRATSPLTLTSDEQVPAGIGPKQPTTTKNAVRRNAGSDPVLTSPKASAAATAPGTVATSLQSPSLLASAVAPRADRVIASGRDMRMPFESRTADAAAFAATVAPAAPSPASLTPSALPTPVPTAAETSPILATASGVAAARAIETPPTAATTATTTPAQVFPLPDRMPEMAARATSAAAAVPTPSAPVPPAPVMQGPAMQVFGAAIAAAQRDERGRPLDQQGDATAMTPVAEAARTTIAATDTTQQAPLDLRQDRWPHSMVDRIAHLRDAAAAMSASAADTTIRLIPDALGTIDVSISRDGDAVSVRFQAEHAATRSMLQDAQGRLADIAESRGLRLSGSSVDGGSLGTGTGTSDQRTPQQPQPTLPGAPPRASTSDPLSADDADSGRVA